jgi:hypothetical protein
VDVLKSDVHQSEARIADHHAAGQLLHCFEKKEHSLSGSRRAADPGRTFVLQYDRLYRVRLGEGGAVKIPSGLWRYGVQSYPVHYPFFDQLHIVYSVREAEE